MDKFFNVSRESCKLNNGADILLPILYYDLSSICFVFKIDKEEAASMLKGKGLKPVISFGGGMAIVMLWEYRDSSVGVYNESTLSTLCYPEGEKHPSFIMLNSMKEAKNWNMGAFVHNLPVTTEMANSAGRTLWSYPKFVTPIPFNLTKSTFEGGVKDPHTNDDIFSVKVKFGGLNTGYLFNTADIVSYTNHNNNVLRTNITNRGKASFIFNSKVAFNIGKSKHIMAENLRRYKLDGAEPIITIAAPKVQCILPLGFPVAKL